ncbi:MAG: efflux transporter outer membrane subunit [Deltaproteobacteria bacterium]|nr:efflux transporter outer membrane subunit [Deltaproteobacteria bacterium]
MLRYRLVYLLIFLLPAGCAMGPDYIRPELALPAAPDNATAQSAPFTAADWWKLFDDPTLDRIEGEALAYNRDLHMAIARVDEARALARIAFADRLPAAGFGAGASRGRLSQEAAEPGKSRINESLDAFGLASFELDLWGKYRRLDEAARAELLATEAARDAVQLSLTAEVAAGYFRLRALEAQTRIARDQLATYDKSCEIYRKRYRLGYTQELDLRRIEADRLATEALLYQRENEQSKAETALALLLGRSPRDIVQGFSEQGKTLEELNVFPRTPENIPSDLLARRPDIRRDEEMLIAANARIGAARAAFFPSIHLTGQYGFASSALENLFTDGANVWTIAGVLTQPVFEGGKLFAREKAARARQEQMLAHYEQTVQNAFRETRDALVAGSKTSQVLAASIERVQATRRSCELSRKQHSRGYISIIDVLDIQRRSLQAELELSAARQGQLDAIIALCRAMGGGWREKADETRLY